MKRIIALIILFVLLYAFQNVGVAENFPVKEKFLILVNEDKDKDAYADFVYFKSARHDVEIFSMNDIGINSKLSHEKKSEKIREDLRVRNGNKEKNIPGKDPIKFLMLDDDIYPGLIDKRAIYSDYFYGFLWVDYFGDYATDTTLLYPEKPDIIVSRMRKEDLKYWKTDQSRLKKLDKVNSMIAFPVVTYYQKGRYISGCAWTISHNDCSYFGDYMKKIFQNNKIDITTLYETRYSTIHTDALAQIEPIKKPDLPLNRESFEKTLKDSNIVFLGYTYERAFFEDDELWGSHYPDDFVTAIWKDDNKNRMADKDSEIELEWIKKHSEMTDDNVKRFFFVPNGGDIVEEVSFPISIRQKFEFDAAPNHYSRKFPREYVQGTDPEKSNVSTTWHVILKEIVNGKTFAESVLLGWRSYYFALKEEDLDCQQGLSLKYSCFGSPDETILDLLPEPYLKIEDNQQINLRNTRIEVANLGEKPLNYKIVNWSKNIEVSNSFNNIGLQPNEKGAIDFKVKYTFPNIYATRPQKKTAWIVVETNDRFWPKKKIEFFWY